MSDQIQEKYKSKIRKLLALAESDNPYEAERAREQARKLMAKHNISEDGIDIVTVKSVTLPRKQLKKYDAMLTGAICHFSGCESFARRTAKARGGKLQWQMEVNFMGLAHDAKIASYTHEILNKQLLSAMKTLRSEYPGVNQRMVDMYAASWVATASKKIVNLFGHKEVSGSVKREYDDRMKGGLTESSRSLKSTGNKKIDEAIAGIGSIDGQKVQLNVATSDQSVKQMRIGFK